VRKLLPVISIGYSIALLVSCLITVKGVIEMPNNNDKVIHAAAYFVFTCLWFYTFFTTFKKSKPQAIKITVIFSIAFGIIIEILQEVTTQTRQADYKDVIANVIGTLLAVLLINLITNLKVKNN
jgi:VanZ family protein|tara:strand:+ start:244248 stop:244619 length:372 start_codon:yes stop_codon:yes gene_type:complete